MEDNNDKLAPVQERSTFLCKICKQERIKIFAGFFDAFNKKFVDENGGTHNGRTCAECHRNKAKDNMKKLRDRRLAKAEARQKYRAKKNEEFRKNNGNIPDDL